MTKSTIIKALGGIGLAATITLGAAACGTSSSTHAASSPTSSIFKNYGIPVPSAFNDLSVSDQMSASNKVYELQDIARMYRSIFNMGSTLPTTTQLFEEEMAPGAPGYVDAETGLPGVVRAIDAPGSQEWDDFVNFGLRESQKPVASQQADISAILSYFDSGSNSSDPAPAADNSSTDSSSTPNSTSDSSTAASDPAQVASSQDSSQTSLPAPAPGPQDATATALASAVMAAGQAGGEQIIVKHYVVSNDGKYAAALVQAPGLDTVTAYFSQTEGIWKMTTLGSGGITAHAAQMSQETFNTLTNELD